MHFKEVAEVFDKVESKSGRIEMTGLLAGLFKKADSKEIEKLVYFVQGVVAPPFEGIELGLGERFAIDAIASATGYSQKDVEAHFKKTGDLGITAEELLKKKKQLSLSKSEMTIIYLHEALMRIAKTSGPGSNELKKRYLAELLNSASPLEARYIIRFVLGRLRLGVGDPTILDALSVARFGDKSWRERLERAYDVCSDIGYVARLFYEDEKKVERFTVQPFKPLMPALAERLSTPEEIIEKIGECASEGKYDGFRLQVHKSGENVELYSRRLDRMTHMFPEIVDAVKRLKEKEIILEGEALAYNKKEGRYYSFQETIQRKRKYGVEEAKKELPLNLFCFDLLYLNGKDYTTEPYSKRRAALEKVIPIDREGILKLSEQKIVKTAEELQECFEDAINRRLEGIMAKDLNAPYTAGKRKFAWIKLKKSYGKAVDTIDGVIVGYYLGKGARAEFKFGGLLIAVYNPDRNKYETVAKIGSGFSEEEMVSLKRALDKIKRKEPPKDLDYRIKPDFWVEPEYVVEVAFDEITLSPIHTCGLHEDKGYALRFPRMLRLREDRSAKEATTTDEVKEMYELQRKGSRKV
ncbi:MAG: ATP-dependent DNA ligase [Candidatus Bilamarchaeaceae archaeon]